MSLFKKFAHSRVSDDILRVDSWWVSVSHFKNRLTLVGMLELTIRGRAHYSRNERLVPSQSSKNCRFLQIQVMSFRVFWIFWTLYQWLIFDIKFIDICPKFIDQSIKNGSFPFLWNFTKMWRKRKKSCNLHKGFAFKKFEKTQEKNKGLGPGFLKFRAHDPVDHQTALEVVVSYLSGSQIRLDPTVDSCQCDYTTVVIRTGVDTNVIPVDGSFFFFLGSARILSSSQPSHLGSKCLLRIWLSFSLQAAIVRLRSRYVITTSFLFFTSHRISCFGCTESRCGF